MAGRLPKDVEKIVSEYKRIRSAQAYRGELIKYKVLSDNFTGFSRADHKHISRIAEYDKTLKTLQKKLQERGIPLEKVSHLKYFTKEAVSITGNSKVDVAAGNKGQGVISRTTPIKKHKLKDNPDTRNTQQPKPTKTDLKEVTAELRDDWNNLKYVTKHKAYIIGPGRELGLGYGQLLKHDNSKLSRKEWGPYRDYWFSDKGIRGERDPNIRLKFRDAVQNSHYRKNPHHTRNHIGDNNLKYRLEEVVDWYAASKAQSSNPGKHPSFKEWYVSHRDRFLSSDVNPVDPLLDNYIINKIM